MTEHPVGQPWDRLRELHEAGSEVIVTTRGFLPGAVGRVVEMSGTAERGHVVIDQPGSRINIPARLIVDVRPGPAEMAT
jgi:hypothetical protein